MARFRLAPRADLAVYYAADAARYRGTEAAAEALHDCPLEKFVELYGACPSIGFEFDGRPIGGILFDGEEAHIAVLPQYHGRWALLLKPALDWLFALRSEIIVKVELDNAPCLAFMERNRWRRLREEGDEAVYLMTPQGGRRKTAHPFGLPTAQAAGPGQS